MWTDKIQSLLKSPITWGVVALILAAIATTGRNKMTLSNILLVLAFLIGSFQIFRSGLNIHLNMVFCLIFGIGLTVLSWCIQHKVSNESTLPKNESTMPKEVATKADLKEMEQRILKGLQKQPSTNKETLENEYPLGYFLFANDKQLNFIPLHKRKKLENYSLDWENCRMIFSGESFIYILLRNFHYYPNEVLVKNLNIYIERKVGSVAYGFYFNNIGLFVKLIDERENSISYVIGFKHIKSIPKIKDLKSGMAEFIKEHASAPMILGGINVGTKKNVTIDGLAIASK